MLKRFLKKTFKNVMVLFLYTHSYTFYVVWGPCQLTHSSYCREVILITSPLGLVCTIFAVVVLSDWCFPNAAFSTALSSLQCETDALCFLQLWCMGGKKSNVSWRCRTSSQCLQHHMPAFPYHCIKILNISQVSPMWGLVSADVHSRLPGSVQMQS